MKNRIHPAAWEIPSRVNGNCYVFSLGPKEEKGGYHRRVYKARPGDKCQRRDDCCYRGQPFDFSDCKEFTSRIVCDNQKYVTPLRKNVSLTSNLPVGYHMMCAMLSPNDHTDFHFARRFARSDLTRSDMTKLLASTPEPAKSQLQLAKPSDYIWLHQRGWMRGGPICYDAANQLITNIRKCNMNYGDLNYNTICTFFKVKTRKATVTKEFEF